MNQRSHPYRPTVRKAFACAVIPLVILTTAGKCSGLVGCARVVGIVGHIVVDHNTKRPEPSEPATPEAPNP